MQRLQPCARPFRRVVSSHTLSADMAFCRHVADVQRRFGDLVLVNLLEQQGKEALVVNAFRKHVKTFQKDNKLIDASPERGRSPSPVRPPSPDINHVEGSDKVLESTEVLLTPPQSPSHAAGSEPERTRT